MRNFLCVAKGIDVGPLLHSLMIQPELWNAHDTRTVHPMSVHRGVDDILLRYNQFWEGEDYVEKVCTELQMVNYPAWSALPLAQPFIWSLMTRVNGYHLGRVMISRLMPGHFIPTHSDRIDIVEEDYPDKIPPAVYYERYHIPLQSDPGVIFHCEDEEVFMEPGSVWWFNNQKLHSVHNNSGRERLELIIDICVKPVEFLPRPSASS